ncbi:hypothetical protein [Streptomyces cupreus]|uniref:Uncharacterized protein n=1 Tax=Streptomyces cupreus TaxID=2759956 RepID=A0A7X1MCS2_9ACTN|nr:hypothetical protein [Streptomyces cupreus]MBC2906744.1 hypothetical protein [Streptomyces cupreus]
MHVARRTRCVGLTVVGTAAFTVGLVFLAAGTNGSKSLFELAAAAWGLAAAIPTGK